MVLGTSEAKHHDSIVCLASLHDLPVRYYFCGLGIGERWIENAKSANGGGG